MPMSVEVTPQYRDTVSHLRLVFRKPEKNGFVGKWSEEWLELVALLHRELQDILARGYGILEVKIVKTEPSEGLIFYADITYWNHP